MTKEELNKLLQDIGNISNNFELRPWTDKVKLLKPDFDISEIDTPKNYLQIIDEISEILRETRLLFLYSVFNKVCEEEGKLYYFDASFQAGMSYSAVMKKDDNFFILDEDGDYREVFTSEAFARFIDNQYWELYE